MSKVISLGSNTPLAPPGAPVEAIVACLKRMLALAEDGVIVGLGVASVHDRGGSTYYGDEAYWRPGANADVFVAVHRLLRRIEPDVGVE